MAIPTLVYIEGFEHQTLSTSGAGFFSSEGNPSEITIDTTKQFCGNACLKIAPTGGSATFKRVTVSGSSSYYALSCDIQVESADAADAELLSIITTLGATPLRLRYKTSDGSFRAQCENATFEITGPAVTFNKWYHMDFLVSVGGAGYTLYWWIDGKYIGGVVTGAVEVGDTVSEIRYGSASAATYVIYLDNIVGSTTPTDAPIGRANVVGAFSAWDGDHNAGDVITTIGEALVYNCLDEWPADTSTYVKQTGIGTGNYGEVGFSSSNIERKVYGVAANLAYFAQFSTPSVTGKTVIRDGNGTETTVYNNDMSETSLFYKSVIVSTPAGGWNQSQVTALRGRVGYGGADTGSNNPRWSALLLQVAFQPATTRLFFSHKGNVNETGTYPSAEQSSSTADITWSGANTLLAMSTHKQSYYVSPTAATASSTSPQKHFVRFWTSRPLKSITTLSGSPYFKFNIADQESNLNANFWIDGLNVYVWRPGNSTKVGTIYENTNSDLGVEATAASSSQVTHIAFSGSPVTGLQDGDVIVNEAWATFAQSSATSYTLGTGFGGITEYETENVPSTNLAAFLEIPQNLEFQPRSLTASGQAVLGIERVLTASGQASLVLEGTVTASGQAVIQGERNLTASGQAVIQGERNLTASGQAVIKAERNLVVSGQAVIQAQRSLVASGQAIIQGERNIIASGQAVIQGERSLVASGQAVIQVERNLTASGQAILGIERTLTASGQAIIKGERNLVASGQAVIQGERNLIASGQAVIQLERNLTASGQAVIIIQGNIIASGQAIIQAERSLVASGQTVIQGERNIAASGQAVIQGERNLTVSGQAIIQLERNLTASGQAVIQLESNLIASGQAVIQGERNLIASGQAIISGTAIPITVSGQAIIQSEVNLTASGQTVIQAEQSLVASGQAVLGIEGSLVASGQSIIQGEQNLVVSGQAIIQLERTLTTSGQAIIQLERNLTASGQAVIQGERNLVVSGQARLGVEGSLTTSGQAIIQLAADYLIVQNNAIIQALRSLTASYATVISVREEKINISTSTVIIDGTDTLPEVAIKWPVSLREQKGALDIYSLILKKNEIPLERAGIFPKKG